MWDVSYRRQMLQVSLRMFLRLLDITQWIELSFCFVHYLGVLFALTVTFVRIALHLNRILTINLFVDRWVIVLNQEFSSLFSSSSLSSLLSWSLSWSLSSSSSLLSSGSLTFLPCDVLYASITEQITGKWNLIVLYNKYMKKCISKDLLNFPGEFSGH